MQIIHMSILIVSQKERKIVCFNAVCVLWEEFSAYIALSSKGKII